MFQHVSTSHEIICKLPWKRFYTTNYDNTIERACLNVGKRTESLDLYSPPKEFLNKKNVCLHINGKVDAAITDDLKSKIKLSDSSYLSSDSFTSSKWHYHFKKDLESSSAIVFIGYSMYDMDVKKFLFDNPSLSDKTYFIIRESASFKETYPLKKFGHILTVGIDGFAEIIKEMSPTAEGEEEFNTESLLKYDVSHSNVEIRDIDSERLFLYGDYEVKKLQQHISEISAVPYFISREVIDKCLVNIKDNKNILILGDLGNGKSIILEMIAYKLSVNGYATYSMHDNGGDYVADFDEISKNEDRAIVIIDNFSNYKKLINHIKEVGLSNIQLILGDRNSNDLNAFEKHDIDFIEHYIDILTEAEELEIVDVIDNLASWKEFSAQSKSLKIKKIKEKYSSQMSLILLGLFNSPNIKEKIKSQTDLIYTNEDFKKTVFAICVCEVINVEPNASLVSEISGTDVIYSKSLRELEAFNQLFKLNGTSIRSKSSILALSLLNSSFDDIYVRDTLLDIVEKTDSLKHQDDTFKKIFKSLLRFHVVERILPQKQSALDRYYEKLKIKCKWLMDSPDYWVQYAMCKLSVLDFNRAQIYLSSAYSMADKKNEKYHTDNIDTQQARLYLNQCVNVENINETFRLFKLAHNLLEDLPIDGRKFRQVILYKDVYQKKYEYFSAKNRVYFEHAIKKMLEQTIDKELKNIDFYHSKRIKFIYLAKATLDELLIKILGSRS